MTMMPVLAVLLITRAARGVVVRVTAFVMVMIVRMKTRDKCVFSCMPMQTGRRSPGKLERDDKHDDHGNETAHFLHSTELTASSKGSFIPWTRLEKCSRRSCQGLCADRSTQPLPCCNASRRHPNQNQQACRRARAAAVMLRSAASVSDQPRVFRPQSGLTQRLCGGITCAAFSSRRCMSCTEGTRGL